MGPMEELEEWVRPKVEVWAHGSSKRYLQSAYAVLGVSLQLEWQ